MYPLHTTELQRERQEELVAAAETWRLAHPCGRHTFRYRTGSRLLRLGQLLMGGSGPYDA